ncbi:MAG: DUF1579 domain-containing protein [Deltaproteobacteria bacterium]
MSKYNIRTFLFSVFLVTFCLGITAVNVIAQDETEQPEAEAMDKMHQEMMAKWKEYATPGENHKALDPMAGEWEYTAKWWNTPDSEPEVSNGTSEAKWIMGDRYLKQKVEGTSMGQEFKGMGLLGYDNASKEYESVWIDNMGTGIMTGSGTYDPAARTFEYKGTYSCPMEDGKDKSYRSVTKIMSDDKYTFEMYMPGPEGEEYRALEIVYTRKK